MARPSRQWAWWIVGLAALGGLCGVVALVLGGLAYKTATAPVAACPPPPATPHSPVSLSPSSTTPTPSGSGGSRVSVASTWWQTAGLSQDPYSPSAYTPVVLQPGLGASHVADYCVVGGGLAGTSAVATLVTQGGVQRWLLFEAQLQLGGRLRSASLSGWTVELGAQWIEGTVDANPLLALAQRIPAALGGPLQGAGSAWDATSYLNENGVDARSAPSSPMALARQRLQAARTCVAQELLPRLQQKTLPDLALRDCYALCGFVPRTPEELALEAATVAALWGEESSVTSCLAAAADAPLDAFGESDGPNTPNVVMDARGMRILAEAALAQARIGADDARIHYGARVTAMNATTNALTVQVGGGAPVVYQCALVISTLPLGALQAAQRALRPLVTHPALSLPAQATLQQVHMTDVRRILLAYPPSTLARFWPTGAVHVVAPAPRDPALGTVHWTTLDVPGTPYAGSGLVVVTQSGPLAAEYEGGGLSDVQLVERTTAALARVLGVEARFSALRGNASGTGWLVSHWLASAQGTEGAHANWPATVTPAAVRALWAPILGHFFWSGEATCPNLMGTATGAYLAGQASALRALVNVGAIAPLDPEANNACFAASVNVLGAGKKRRRKR